MRVIASLGVIPILITGIISTAPPKEHGEAANPWRGTDIDLRFLDETINAGHCSRSDRNFLSCIGSVQRVLDVHGGELHLIPLSDLADRNGSRQVVERFGAAAIIEDTSLRIGNEGNALAVIRAGTHRILRWRDRLDPSLRRAVDFAAIKRWLITDIIDSERKETFAAAAIDGYLGVADAHARIAPAGRIQGSSGEQRGDNPVNSTSALVYTGIGAGVQPMADAALVTAVVRGGPLLPSLRRRRPTHRHRAGHRGVRAARS